MTPPTLTRSMLNSAWIDAYNAARRQGLPQHEAAEKAQTEFDRLLAIIGGPEAWLELPQ